MVLSLPFVILLPKKSKNNSSQSELILYCAAGLRLPIQKIVSEFQNEYGVRINIQFGGSGSLLANIEAVNRGDLYLAADSSYTEIADNKGLINKSIPICELNAGLIVKKGNPIRVLRDNIVIYEGELESLRRHKDDVNEVKNGYECGLSIADFNDIKVRDVIESFEIKEINLNLINAGKGKLRIEFTI